MSRTARLWNRLIAVYQWTLDDWRFPTGERCSLRERWIESGTLDDNDLRGNL